MGGGHLTVGVKPSVALGQDRQRLIALPGRSGFQQILHAAGLAGAGGDEHGIGDQRRPTVRVGAEFGGPAQPLHAHRKPSAADGQPRGGGEHLGHLLVGFGARLGQVGGPAHQHLAVESREVAVGVAAFLRISLVDDRRANQGVAKDDNPNGFATKRPACTAGRTFRMAYRARVDDGMLPAMPSSAARNNSARTPGLSCPNRSPNTATRRCVSGIPPALCSS